MKDYRYPKIKCDKCGHIQTDLGEKYKCEKCKNEDDYRYISSDEASLQYLDTIVDAIKHLESQLESKLDDGLQEAYGIKCCVEELQEGLDTLLQIKYKRPWWYRLFHWRK